MAKNATHEHHPNPNHLDRIRRPDRPSISPSKTMKKQPKKYPMNGPSLHIQRLMESPRRNADELKSWAKSKPEMRSETLAIISLK